MIIAAAGEREGVEWVVREGCDSVGVCCSRPVDIVGIRSIVAQSLQHNLGARFRVICDLRFPMLLLPSDGELASRSQMLTSPSAAPDRRLIPAHQQSPTCPCIADHAAEHVLSSFELIYHNRICPGSMRYSVLPVLMLRRCSSTSLGSMTFEAHMRRRLYCLEETSSLILREGEG